MTSTTPLPDTSTPAPETRLALVRWAATLWSLVLFMPVGMSYLAFFLLIGAMLLQGPRRARLQRLRGHPLVLPLALYGVWILVVLATQSAYYAETPSNLWHAFRIVMTLLLAQALSRDEALTALRAFLLAALVAVVVVAVGHTFPLPPWLVWERLLVYGGNRSISSALMMAVLAGSCVVLALNFQGRLRQFGIVAALVLLGCLLVSLPNRTSLLIILLALPAAALHQWRQQHSRIAMACVATALAAGALVGGVPQVRNNLQAGIAEVEQGIRGEAVMASWNIRVQMIRHTGNMIIERPWMGWGMGAWNEQWRKRVPPAFAELNMPHNDFLWMGSQAGLPGALIWIAIPLTAVWVGWKRRDVTGRLAFVAALSMLGSSLVNSAMRDGVIGMNLLWLVGLYIRLANDPEYHFEPEALFARRSR